MIRPSTVAALFVLLVALPAAAAPKSPKVALTAIDGDGGGEVRDAVAEALDGNDLTLIGEKETNRAADKLGDLSDLNEKQAKKLATALEADAIVHGKLEKQNGTKVLKFQLFVNGHKAKGFSVQFSNAKSKKFKDQLREKMVEKITSEPGDDKAGAKKKGGKVAAEAAEDDEDPNAKGKKGKKLTKAEKAKAEKAEKAEKEKAEAEKTEKAEKSEKSEKVEKSEKAEKPEGDDEEAKPRKSKKKKTAKVDDDEEETGSVSIRAASPHAANRVAVRADVGLSVSARRLTFTSTNSLENKPIPFKQSPVGGFRFDADIYPFAFSNPKSPVAGFGLGIDYDKVISSKATTSGGLEPGISNTVKQQYYKFAARYRIAFTKTPASPTVTLGLGYARRSFVVNQNPDLMDRLDLDLPDTDYKYIAPELAFRIPIGPFVAFTAGGDAMLIRDAGPIQLNNSYGKAKVFGVNAQAGLDIVLGNRFAIKFVGEYTQIGYTFTGGGERANNRDGDPSTIDIGGAADRSFGGAATLAVLY